MSRIQWAVTHGRKPLLRRASNYRSRPSNTGRLMSADSAMIA
jgi:hypothetical protein